MFNEVFASALLYNVWSCEATDNGHIEWRGLYKIEYIDGKPISVQRIGTEDIYFSKEAGMKLSPITITSEVVRQIQDSALEHIRWNMKQVGIPSIEATRIALAASDAVLAEINRDDRIVIEDDDEIEENGVHLDVVPFRNVADQTDDDYLRS